MNALVEPIRLTDFMDDYESSTEDFFQTSRMGGRDHSALEAKLVSDFELQNRKVLLHYNISVRYKNTGRGGRISFSTGEYVGALPLKSPLSGKWDYRAIIRPRIGWSGIGGMLSVMGWKVIPSLQKLPPLPQSAKEIPSWVIASVIIARIEGLLKDISRKYVPKTEVLKSPRGRIDWADYARRMIPSYKWTDMKCDFSELSDHPDLMGVIRYTLQKVIGELSSCSEGGIVALDLIQRANKLLKLVASFLPVRPNARMFMPIFYGRGIPSESFAEGLEAIQWSAEERGLAGLSDLRGLPWRMSIADFFEAYIETIARRVSIYSGGSVTCGRQNETVIPVQWESNWLGTQKSLKPDVVIKKDDEIIIVDAKFKGYWRQIFSKRWEDVSKEFQEEHRNDFLQVLAYSTCFAVSKLTVCLVFACERDEYEEFRSRGILHRRAVIGRQGRIIRLILTAVPMQGNIDKIAEELAKCFLQE